MKHDTATTRRLLVGLATLGIASAATAGVIPNDDCECEEFSHVAFLTNTLPGGFLPPVLLDDDSYSGLFDLGAGYTPGTLLSATVKFRFSDDRSGDGSETVDIKLNGSTLVSGVEVNGNIFDPGSFTVIEELVPAGAAFDYLNLNGTLPFEAIASRGDFYLKEASIVAKACPRSVPDGGSTAALMGAALFGVGALRRKLAR